ncbi:MAG TPA: mersacidin/lichenicidin family type 2 lantibiotic [Pyrinomonadaceae bacterium]|nr:mersacidin/lichenicidin family type 2 lantibiotic [Pyrinomonadaceae bacterium]
MSKLDIIRAWKDEEYFSKLSESERSQLPANPVGVIELTDQDLTEVDGGTTMSLTLGCDSLFFCPYTLGCTATITLIQENIDAG